MGRYIGVRHRVKRTASGEAHPTEIHIVGPKGGTDYKLETEEAELDFVRGRFPTKMRKVKPDDDVSTYPEHHVEWREVRAKDDISEIPTGHIRVENAILVAYQMGIAFNEDGSIAKRRRVSPDEDLSGIEPEKIIWRKAKEFEDLTEMREDHLRVDQDGSKTFVAIKIPAAYDGLSKGDHLGMVLSGTGNDFAFALSKTAELLGEGTFVGHIHSKKLKDKRGDSSDDDARVLAELTRDYPNLFDAIMLRDRKILHIKHALRLHKFAQQDRIKCSQRVQQIFMGTIFYDENAEYPEGSIAKALARELANNTRLAALTEVEDDCQKNMGKAVRVHPVWKEILKDVKGIGPGVAAGLLGSIGMISRFERPNDLVRYFGLHRVSGQFVRKRSGEVANWVQTARQALFNFDDQLVRHGGDSVWSERRAEIKAEYRRLHPHRIKVRDGLKHLLRGVAGVLKMGDVIIPDEGLELKTAAEIGELLETGVASNPGAFSEPPEAELVNYYREVIAEITANGKTEVIIRKARSKGEKDKKQKWSEEGSLLTLFSDGHIHKMARWRTLTEFTRWLWEAMMEQDRQIRATAQASEAKAA